MPSKETKEKKVPDQRIGRKQKEKITNQRLRESKKRKEGKFPIKEWEKAKRKERKFQVKEKRMGESKKEASSRSKKPEEMCREVFGPDNI